MKAPRRVWVTFDSWITSATRHPDTARGWRKDGYTVHEYILAPKPKPAQRAKRARGR